MAEKTTPGQRLKGSPIRKASVQNGLLDLLNEFKGRELGKAGRGIPLANPTDMVTVKNLAVQDSSYLDLPRGTVLQLGDLLLDEIDPNNFWFQGVQPGFGNVHMWRYVVTKKPIKEGKIGDAQASGVCLARVDVLDPDHNFALPVYDTLHFESSFIGPVELLHAPDGTGVQEMIVRFPVPIQDLYGFPDDPIPFGTSGTVSIWDDIAGIGSDTGWDIEVWAPYADSNGTACQISLLNGRPVIHTQGCQ